MDILSIRNDGTNLVLPAAETDDAVVVFGWKKKGTLGIFDGELKSNILITGSCMGTSSNTYECGGPGKFIEVNQSLDASDFVIKSEFLVDKVEATALVFYFRTKSQQIMYVGLDGHGNTFFLEGGRWDPLQYFGSTTLQANKMTTITLTRAFSKLEVKVNNMVIPGWEAIYMPDNIISFGWRPHRNTIHIKSLITD